MAHVFCIREMPWAETRGIMNIGCAAERDLKRSPVFGLLSPEIQEKIRALPVPEASTAQPTFYRNHPFVYPVLLAVWSKILGEREWVFRLFTILLSVLNIYLVYAVGRVSVRRMGDLPPTFPLWGAFFQAGFQGGLYFGSHVDFLGEFTTAFLLLTTLAAIDRRWVWASVFGMIAGLTDWPGFLVFAPLALVAWLYSSWRGLVTVCAGGGVAALSAVGMIGYLTNQDFIEFFRSRISGSVEAREAARNAPPDPESRWLWLRLLHGTLQAYSRFLSPLFSALALQEIFDSSKRIFKRRQLNEIDAAVVILGGTIAVTAFLSPLHVMIHPFWFMLAVPAGALLAARYVCRRGWVESRWAFVVTLFVTTAFFPYGMWKYSFALDLFIGLSFIACSFVFVWFVLKGTLNLRRMVSVFAFVVLLNFLQTMNYRLEPNDPRPFCAELLSRYIESGQPVQANRGLTLAERYYYCRGIPIIE